MTASLLMLTVCYALLALLVLAMSLYTRWHIMLKTVAIVAFVGLAMLNYEALAGMLGYPTPGRLPQRFVYHSAVVNPPNATTGARGSIYLWATELSRDGPAGLPRAFELPYEKDNATALTQAAKRQQEGIVQLGTALEPMSGEQTGLLSRFQLEARHPRLKMMDKPDPSLPEK